MSRPFAGVWAACLLLVAPNALAQDATPPDPSRMKIFLSSAILSPGPYALDLSSAVLDQLSDFPEEWSGGRGFGQRVGSRVAGGLTSNVVGHSVAAVLGHRVLYEPCGCDGVWPRTTHALGRGFLTRTDRGGLAPHLSLVVAKATTARVAAAWYPASYDRNDMVREAAFGVGVNALLNVAREFSPELLRLLGRH